MTQCNSKTTAPKQAHSLVKQGGVFAIALCSSFSLSSLASTAPDTQVTNTANVSYDFKGRNYQSSDSNRFVTAKVQGTPSVITLMHNSINFSAQLQAAQNNQTGNSSAVSGPIQSRSLVGQVPQPRNTSASSNGTSISGAFPVNPGLCSSDANNSTLVNQAQPKDYLGNTLNIPSVLNLTTDDYFKVGDAIFIYLQDLDQNLDSSAIETTLVTIQNKDGSDAETIQLTETDVDTGLFTGYVQSVDLNQQAPVSYDCQLSVTSDTTMQARYQDKFDAVDISAAGALFDPHSYLINADTGEYVNGIEVTLIDTTTGQAADVLSSDGGIFPNPVTTGATVSDSKGNQYTFPYGGFSFPVIDNGQYQIQVADTAYLDYPIPVEKSLEDINALPAGPFSLDEKGSRALAFDVDGITFRMDIPLDPKDNNVLITKTANKTQASAGDVISYNVKIQNTEIPGSNVRIKDTLPQGFRYVEGSARLSGVTLADPVISDNGRELTFTIANIAVEETVNLRYVARVSVNAPMGQATNTVWLEDQEDIVGEGILKSNVSQAHVEIKEELFSEATRLFGRVYIGDCESNAEQEGIAGVRIYLENGTYVVTDEDGMWHIEGQKPGTHVVQLDTDTLPKYLDLMACENYGKHTGRSYSQFVDLAKGSFWRSDFVVKLKPPSKGEVTQRLSSQVAPISDTEKQQLSQKQISVPVAQKLVYRLDLNGTEVILKNLRSLIMFPEGVKYKAGSVKLDGRPIAPPKYYDEQTLLFDLNDPGKDWAHTLEFEAWITDKAQAGELTTRSVAMFTSPSENSQRTPVALTSALLGIVPDSKVAHKPENAPRFGSFSEKLSQDDTQALQGVLTQLRGLQDLKIEVAGHTDDVPIARRSRHIFKDNYELSLARARSAANYLMTELNLRPDQVTITGYGSRKPSAQNTSKENRAKNRRVEVNILAGSNGMQLAKADSGNHMVVTQGVAPGGFDFPIEATASGPIRTSVSMPEIDSAYLAQRNNEFEWVWPAQGYLPNIPSTKVAIKHPLNHKVQLKLNGRPVSQLNFAKRVKYAPNQSAVSIWAGVDIQEGDNLFEASLVDENENILNRQEFSLHYAGTPTRAEIVKSETKALADGVVNPVIAVKLFDKDGYPVRDGLQGEFSIDSPYQALNPNKGKAQINQQDFKPNYEVVADGIAYITLEPTTQAGEAVLRFPMAQGKEEEIRVWLTPQNRDWMLVALGEGTIGYNQISNNIENAESQGSKDELYTDGRLALFAKGQILGDWLLTAAYDSNKNKTTPFEKLLEPNKYYTLYGDNSEQKLDASMEGQLYVRIEKERFYTVFGDYSTDLNRTELSKYLRKFHGIQSVFQGDIVSFNAFATESAQTFVRDEIQGDGTSGLYRLSKQDIINNSETISIQVRDRFRSEVILSEAELVKDADYSIDYIDGSLFFKTPINSTDENLNPRYIVVRYETQNDNENDLTYGGRIALHGLNKQIEVGATHISEELGVTQKTLNAMDMRLKLSNVLEIKAETAITETNTSEQQSTANYISVDYRGEQLQTKAYVRTEESGFGLDQLNAAEGNTEKLGVEASYYMTSQQYMSGLLSDQNTLGSEQRTSRGEIKFNQEYQLGRYHLGARVNEQTSADGNTSNSQQLLAGHSFTLLDGQLLLNSDIELHLNKKDDSYDLLRLGSDYRINEQVTLFGTFETGFESEAPQRTVAGLRASPWQGMQVNNSVEQQQSKDGSRLFAVHGLNQEINLNDHWQISFGFDQAQDLENSINDSDRNQEDFYALSSGWGYRSPTWQWTNRIEYRESNVNEKWNALTGIYRPVALGLAMGINAEYRLDDSDTSRTEFKEVEFDIGLRPLTLGLAWLNQSKLITEEQISADSSLVSRRLLNNTHINMRWHQTQLSAQYGFKYVDETIDDVDYTGYIDLMGTQMRHYLNNRWDWGLHAQRLYDYELSNSQHSFGLSLGYTPQSNTWVSLGYNFAGFDDSDFDNAGYSAHGIYLKLRIKADQDNMKALRAYFQ